MYISDEFEEQIVKSYSLGINEMYGNYFEMA